MSPIESTAQRRHLLDILGFGLLAHRQGAVFETPVPLSEALEEADLDWRVEVWDTTCHATDSSETPTVDNRPASAPMPFARALVRVNKDRSYVPLSVVGTRYVPVQNREAFDFAVNLLDEHGAEVVAAGYTGDGKDTFLALRVPRSLILGDDNVIHCYALMQASHGEAAMVTRVVPVHAATGTELTTNMISAPQEFKVRHSGDIGVKLREAEGVMSMIEEWAVEFEGMSSRMLGTRMTPQMMDKFAHHVLPTPRGAQDRAAEDWARRRQDMTALFNSAAQGFGAGTVFAAFWAANEYIDHHSTTRANVDAALVRAQRSLNGEARKLKHRAWAWIEKNV